MKPGLRRVRIEAPGTAYEVMIGGKAISLLRDAIPKSARRAAIVTQKNIPVSVETGVKQKKFLIGRDESHKSLKTVEVLCEDFAEWGLTRGDVIVAVGGGVVTDTAGLAAALYMRGVCLINIPTTLLGQVDAAIGGKTGVNLRCGKNLAGAFWQPIAVFCDTDLLATLPHREFHSGLSEMAKYGLIDRSLHLESSVPLKDRIADCVATKAAFVTADERETGRRVILNYGHTLAHAIEPATNYAFSHGEAVAVGLIFAAELAYDLGRIEKKRLNEHYRVVESYQLPIKLPPNTEVNALIKYMAHDKKVVKGLTFVLAGPEGFEVVSNVSVEKVKKTLSKVIG